MRIHDGFVTMECLVAIALFSMTTVATFGIITQVDVGHQRLLQKRDEMELSENKANTIHSRAKQFSITLNEIERVENEIVQTTVVRVDPYIERISVKSYRENTRAPDEGDLTTLVIDPDAEGGTGCDARLRADWKYPLVIGTFSLPIGQKITAIDVVGSYAYVTANSSTLAQPDFYIIDISSPEQPNIISSLNTGPGLNALHVAGRYAYAANSSSNSQMQIIAISDPLSPLVISSLKMPGVSVSGGAGIGKSIWFYHNKIYLGLTKATGSEFHVIDVIDVAHPKAIGALELGTTVNKLIVFDDRAFVATPTADQLRMVDVADPNTPHIRDVFRPDDSQHHSGMSLGFSNDKLFFGRNVDAIGVTSEKKEIFSININENSFSAPNFSIPIHASVNDIVARYPYVILATNDDEGEVQIWNISDEVHMEKTARVNLDGPAVSLDCESSMLIVGSNSGNNGHLSFIIGKE